MRASTAVVGLLKAEEEWRQFFKRCCETSAFLLRSQTWQFWDELAERSGAKTPRGGRPAGTYLTLEDVLVALARELFPGSPASQWDTEWAHELCRDALARIGEHYSGLSEVERYALNLSVQDPYEERMVAAGEANDPAAFREALKGLERASLEALDKARAGRGAA